MVISGTPWRAQKAAIAGPAASLTASTPAMAMGEWLPASQPRAVSSSPPGAGMQGAGWAGTGPTVSAVLPSATPIGTSIWTGPGWPSHSAVSTLSIIRSRLPGVARKLALTMGASSAWWSNT